MALKVSKKDKRKWDKKIKELKKKRVVRILQKGMNVKKEYNY